MEISRSRSPKVLPLTPAQKLARKIESLAKCALKHDLHTAPINSHLFALFSGTDEIGRIKIEGILKSDTLCFRVGNQTTTRPSQAIRWLWLAHKESTKKVKRTGTY